MVYSSHNQLLLVASFTQTYLREYLFGVERKIALHNPVVIARVSLDDFYEATALVLPEVDDLFTFVIVDEVSRKVNIVGE